MSESGTVQSSDGTVEYFGRTFTAANPPTAEDVVAAVRQAWITARDFDEGDDELDQAWRTAYLIHAMYDPTLATRPGRHL